MIPPNLPSVFKKTGEFCSARLGSRHRVLARWNEDEVEWFWIGSHDEYEELIG